MMATRVRYARAPSLIDVLHSVVWHIHMLFALDLGVVCHRGVSDNIEASDQSVKSACADESVDARWEFADADVQLKPDSPAM